MPGGFVGSIGKRARNNNKRYVKPNVADDWEIAYVSLEPGQDLPDEVHFNKTQITRVEQGEVVLETNKMRQTLSAVDGDQFLIVPGTWHSVKNEGDEVAKLSTIYVLK